MDPVSQRALQSPLLGTGDLSTSMDLANNKEVGIDLVYETAAWAARQIICKATYSYIS